MMLSQTQLKDLAKTYLVANTPLYLYRRFRAHPSVQRLARTVEPVDILHEFRQNASVATRDGDILQTSYLYALLVSISILPYPVARELMEKLGPSHLDWQDEIVRIIRATGVGETETTVTPRDFIGTQATLEVQTPSVSTQEETIRLRGIE